MLLPKPLLRASRRALRALRDPYVPILAHLVVTRRCNLSCGYCNEYDDFSTPVPFDALEQRIERLEQLGTVVITLTGGEPLLHPQLHAIIATAVRRGVVCTAITNGYPLTRTWVQRLNDSGLTLLQISIDNVEANRMSQKSWSRLRPRLELLRDHARFGVNVNAVLGSCIVEETRGVAAQVREMGFYMTVGLMHDGHGRVDTGVVGKERLKDMYAELAAGSRRSVFHGLGQGWEEQMLQDGESEWKCRAGARYLYVDEVGSVSYCSQLRGEPGISLLDYTRDDVVEAFHAPKECAERCTIGCVRRVSAIDHRRPQERSERDERADELAAYSA